MLVHYVEWFYPGIIVTETSSEKIKSRDKLPPVPEHAFGYRFFDREEVKKGKEVLLGTCKNYSPKYYFGEEMTLSQVKDKMPKENILIRNMECNGYKKIVHTQYEQYFPLEKKDKVVKRPA